MSRSDRFDFTLDEETEKRLYDLLTDMDTRNTDRFWITDKRGYHAEYVKVIRCKECKYYEDYWEVGYCMHHKGLNGKPCAIDYREERRISVEKRTQSERLTIVEALLTSLWDEISEGEIEAKGAYILQQAVDCQIFMNRIVWKLNEERHGK